MFDKKALVFIISIFAAPVVLLAADNFGSGLSDLNIENLRDLDVPGASISEPRRYSGPNDYPVLKTAAVSFNSGHYVRVADGKIWLRPNYERTGLDYEWKMVQTPKEAGRIREVSADGDNLIAVSEAGRIFYKKFSSRHWFTRIGKPLGRELYLPDNRGWAVSHMGPEAGSRYQDPDGKSISNIAGVSTIYVLSKDGTAISYVDPWLPGEFSYYVGMPLRGRFIAEAISASASTLFIIDGSGRMFTRFADFDSMGCDPFLSYSFEHDPTPGVIQLPAEPWREQPRIDGRVMAKITIIQNGEGNAARELRVEGVDGAGNGGYYSKMIYDEGWTFVKTGAVVEGPFLAGSGTLGPVIDGDYQLAYRRLPAGSVLRGFHTRNDSSEIIVPGLESMPLKLHTRQAFFPNRPGEPARLFGEIELPDELMFSLDPAAAQVLRRLGGKKFSEVFVKVTDNRVELGTDRYSFIGRLAHVSRLSEFADSIIGGD